MSMDSAVAFLERLEADEAFANELKELHGDQAAAHAKVTAAGFDATPEEIRDAVVERYGAELTPEQLDAIAGGLDPNVALGLGVGLGVVATVAVGAALAAAVF